MNIRISINEEEELVSGRNRSRIREEELIDVENEGLAVHRDRERDGN